MFSRRTLLFRLTLSLACLGWALAPLSARAQAAYPNKAVRLVVPYTAGGITDVLARALAECMRTHLGQPVIVENRPGANTALAAKGEQRRAGRLHGAVRHGATAVLNPLLYPSSPTTRRRSSPRSLASHSRR